MKPHQALPAHDNYLRPWVAALLAGLSAAGIASLLFLAVHPSWIGGAAIAAGSCGVGAVTTYPVVRALLGPRPALPVTIWIFLCVIVMVFAPVSWLQIWAAAGLVGLWTRCIAFTNREDL